MVCIRGWIREGPETSEDEGLYNLNKLSVLLTGKRQWKIHLYSGAGTLSCFMLMFYLFSDSLCFYSFFCSNSSSLSTPPLSSMAGQRGLICSKLP